MRLPLIATLLVTSAAHGVEPLSASEESLFVQKNLKMIGLAFHNYHDIFGRFPPATMPGPDGETLHSWRVELLPLLRPAARPIRLGEGPASLRKQWDEWIEADGYRLKERCRRPGEACPTQLVGLVSRRQWG